MAFVIPRISRISLVPKTVKSWKNVDVVLGVSGTFFLSHPAAKVEIYAGSRCLRTLTNLKAGTNSFEYVNLINIFPGLAFRLEFKAYNNLNQSSSNFTDSLRTPSYWTFGEISIVGGKTVNDNLKYVYNNFSLSIVNNSNDFALPIDPGMVFVNNPLWKKIGMSTNDTKGEININLEYNGEKKKEDQPIGSISINLNYRGLNGSIRFLDNSYYRIRDLALTESNFLPKEYKPIDDLENSVDKNTGSFSPLNFISSSSFLFNHIKINHPLNVTYEYEIDGKQIDPSYLNLSESDNDIFGQITNKGIYKILDDKKIPKDAETKLYSDITQECIFKIIAKDGLQTITQSIAFKINYDYSPIFSNEDKIELKRSAIAYFQQQELNPNYFLEKGYFKVDSEIWFPSKLLSKGQYVFLKFPKPKYYNNDALIYYLEKYSIPLKENGSTPTFEDSNKIFEEVFTPLDVGDFYICDIYSGKNYRPDTCETYKIKVRDKNGNEAEIRANDHVVWCRTNSPRFAVIPTINIQKEIDSTFTATFTFGQNNITDSFRNLNIGDSWFIDKEDEEVVYSNYEVREKKLKSKGLQEFYGVLPPVEDEEDAPLLGSDLPPVEDEEDAPTLDSLPYSETIDFKMTVTLSDTSDFSSNETSNFFTGQIQKVIENNKVVNVLLKDINNNSALSSSPAVLSINSEFSKFYVKYELEVGYSQSEVIDELATVIGSNVIYFYGDVPTVAYRTHQVGINIENPEDEKDAVLIVQPYDAKKVIILQDEQNNKKIIIDLIEGSIDGAIIRGGTW